MLPIFFFIMKKLKAEFTVNEEYLDFKGKTQLAGITLKINYLAKSFNIVSSNETDFVFKNGTNQSVNMWVAIAKCVEKATLFAKEELYD